MLVDLLKSGAGQCHRIFGTNLGCFIKWDIDERRDRCNVYVKPIHVRDSSFPTGEADGFMIDIGRNSKSSFGGDSFTVGTDSNEWTSVGTDINFMSSYIDRLVEALRKANGDTGGIRALVEYTPVDGEENLFYNIRKNKALYRFCIHCNEYKEVSKFTYYTNVCDSCQEGSVVCPNCGSMHKEGVFKKVSVGDTDYCSSCILDYTEKGVARETRYSRKVDPIFYGYGAFHFGVEFEVEVKRDENYGVQDVMDIVHKFNKHVYFKGDTSIDHGVEIITHPCSYSYHKDHTSPMLDMLSDIDTYGDNTGTCGLHIHIGRDRLYGDKEVAIGRIMYIFNKHWNKIVKFARRDAERLERWGKRPVGGDVPESVVPKENPFFMKQRKKVLDLFFKSCYNANEDLDRYRAVNLKCVNTIEFRVFDGTTTNKYFLASLQFVHMVMELANSDYEIIGKSFEDLFYADHKIFNEVYDELIGN